jgi:hypothetical protein
MYPNRSLFAPFGCAAMSDVSPDGLAEGAIRLAIVDERRNHVEHDLRANAFRVCREGDRYC